MSQWEIDRRLKVNYGDNIDSKTSRETIVKGLALCACFLYVERLVGSIYGQRLLSE
jgi:hypothetical protein